MTQILTADRLKVFVGNTELSQDLEGAAEKLNIVIKDVARPDLEELSRKVLIDRCMQQDAMPKLVVLREEYDKMDPVLIRKTEEKFGCTIVPLDKEEYDKIHIESGSVALPLPTDDVKIFKRMPIMLPHDTRQSHSTPHIEPRNFTKKKKAKRRLQKQGRKRNK